MNAATKKAPRGEGKPCAGQNTPKSEYKLLYKKEIVNYYTPDWPAIIRGMDARRGQIWKA
jgi:hypothetical protein